MSGLALAYPTYDADNHFYEPPEALMRHLPKEFKNAISYVQVNGRTKLAIGGQITDYIPDPTFGHVAAPGRLVDWFSGNNPEGLTMRESMGKPIAPKLGWRTGQERLLELDEQGLTGALMLYSKVSSSSPPSAMMSFSAMNARIRNVSLPDSPSMRRMALLL